MNVVIFIIAVAFAVAICFILGFNNKDQQKANKIAIIGMILSLIINLVILVGNTIVSTVSSSKAFQIADNMKSDLWDLECTLRSIKLKNVNDNVDFSHEKDVLNRIQKSQGYYVLLYSVDDEKDRQDLEDNIQQLTGLLTNWHSADAITIQSTADNIIRILIKENNKNLMHSSFWNKIFGILNNDRLDKSHSKLLEELNPKHDSSTVAKNHEDRKN